jgi:dipeptidyl aminopeptidase/acylaminoacyl peptidase
MGRLLRVGWIAIVVGIGTAGAQTHPFNIHDLVAMDRISEPRVSPDGKWIVFVLRTTDLEANKGRTDLWLVGVDGSGLRRLTSHPDADNNPRWAPDGRTVYFLSARSGASQVWIIPSDGGEAQQITRQPLDVSSLVVSRDGTHLAFSMEVFPDATVDETRKRLDEKEKSKASGRIYDRLFFRHWDSWKDGRRAHVFVMQASGGAAVDVMKAMDADAPTKPFGGPEEIAFTPDGRSIVFTARDEGRAEAWSTNMDLWVVPIDASARPKRLTEGNEAFDSTPVFSPNGRTLAYLAMARPGYEADRQTIMLMDWPDGNSRPLTAGWDRSPSEIAWSSDGRTILAAADHIGQHALFAIDLGTGEPRTIVGQGTVHDPQDAGGRIVYSLNSLTSPAELFSVSLKGDDPRQITHVNGDKLAKVQFGEPEQFSFTGAYNDQVYAYVVIPPNLKVSQKYPVAFLIHGGPQGSFGNDFHYRWNPQVYAGAGYAAVMVDFHGSTGYGQKFCDAIRGDWGGKPLEDLKKGLDAALKRYPWMDGDRVAALGASYGGYMINWIAGNWPDRFRCLVCHDGNLDERLAYYNTEELWFPEWEHMGTPWDNPESYERHNPERFVQNWKTPMLVIHGGQDFRVVDTEGFSTFTALQRRGIPSKLLYFPDENHWVLKPANSILWHETVLAWLDQWTKK